METVEDAARTLCGVAATRKERGIPDAWRAALYRHVSAFRDAQPVRARTQRALAGALGVSNYTINGILNRNGPVGLDVLVILRDKLSLSIDDLLGLPPLADALTPDEVRRLRELVAIPPPSAEGPHAPPASRPARSRPRRGMHD